MILSGDELIRGELSLSFKEKKRKGLLRKK